MGLFDLFKKKKQQDDSPQPQAEAAGPSGGGSPWPKQFAKLRGFELEDDEKRALIEKFLNELAPRFENAKVKTLVDDDEVELRARVDGIPVRINVEQDMGWVRPEMKIANRVGPLSLQRDHEKIPKGRDADDDWADEDELRVFVAKGIFVEGDDDDVNETLTTLSSLPPETSQHFLAEIERMGLSHISAYSESVSVSLPNLQDMVDPIQQITGGVALMKTLAMALSSGDRDMASEPKVIIRGNVQINGVQVAPTAAPSVAHVTRVKCSYCSTLFLLGATSKCPNCAAPYTG